MKKFEAVSASCFTFALCSLMTLALYRSESERHRVSLRARTLAELSSLRGKIEVALNRRIFLVNGLRSYVSAHPEIARDEFQRIASILQTQAPGIRSFTLIEDNVISDVYPLQGNERAIGVKPIENTSRREYALVAIDADEPWLEGPIDLQQGGNALVARAPVYTTPLGAVPSTGRYWGMVSLLIDLQTIENEVRPDVSAKTFRFAVLADHLGTVDDGFFLGDPDLESTETLQQSIEVPGGNWTLIGAPTEGLNAASSASTWIAGVGSLLSLIFPGVVGTFVWLRQKRKEAAEQLDAVITHVDSVQQKASQAESRLDEVLRVADVGLWEWDLQTNRVDYSPTYKTQLGFGDEDSWGNDFEEWRRRVHPEDLPKALGTIERYLARESDFYRVTFRMRTKENTYRWILAQGRAGFDESGRPHRMVGVHLDVTERMAEKQILDQMSRLAKIGGWELDLIANELTWSDEVCRIHGVPTGYKPVLEEAIDFYPGDAKTNISNAVQRAIDEHEPWDVECEFLPADGKTIWVRAIGEAVVEEDRCVRLWGTLQDVSEQRKSRETLRQALDQLSTSNEELARFAYLASHDLRAPLRGIQNLMTWIHEDLTDQRVELPDTIAGYMVKMTEQADRMDRLLTGLLEYSRAGQKRGTIERLESSVVIQNAIQLAAASEGFRVQCLGEFPVIIGQRSPLERIFLNLIDNAVKHHDCDSGCINVRCTESNDNDFARFEVVDDGPGIPEQHRERVFEIFKTLPAKRENKNSTGIGLSIVKKLVENAGGEIGIADADPRGTLIWFTWPIRSDPRQDDDRQ